MTEPGVPPGTELILYQTEDRRTRVEVRLADGTVWLTQAQMAELFQTSVPNINIHLKEIYSEDELDWGATIKPYLIVRQEGSRTVSRAIRHYSLEAILAVGYRVRSPCGTQFRQWATARLNEFLVKGFTLDDERLKNPQRESLEILARVTEIVPPANELTNDEVLAKQTAAREWCARATDFTMKHGGKPWRYVLIPDDQIAENASLEWIVDRFAAPGLFGASS